MKCKYGTTELEGGGLEGLIEAYWNVNSSYAHADTAAARFNRSILKCKFVEGAEIDEYYWGLIEAYWNVN